MFLDDYDNNKYKNYVISNDTSYKVKDLVKTIYKLHNIYVFEKDNSLIDVESQKKIVVMDSYFRNDTTDIKGDNSDLKSIGWAPTYTVEDTLREIGSDII